MLALGLLAVAWQALAVSAGSCAVSRQLSSTRCVLGQSFGCNANGTVWVADGCRAVFRTPSGGQIQCWSVCSGGGRTTCEAGAFTPPKPPFHCDSHPPSPSPRPSPSPHPPPPVKPPLPPSSAANMNGAPPRRCDMVSPSLSAQLSHAPPAQQASTSARRPVPRLAPVARPGPSASTLAVQPTTSMCTAR